VVGQSLINTTFRKRLEHIQADRLEMTVVMEISDVIVIGNIPANSRVSRLGNVLRRIRVKLLGLPAIHSFLDDLPPEVMVGQMALQKRGSCR
jgi:hypothetical protein